MSCKILFYNSGSLIKVYTWATSFGFKPVKKSRFGFFSAPIFFLRRDWSFQNHPSWKKFNKLRKKEFFLPLMDNNKKERREGKERKCNNRGRKRKVVKQTTEREKGEGNIEREKWNRKTNKWQKEFWSSKLQDDQIVTIQLDIK